MASREAGRLFCPPGIHMSNTQFEVIVAGGGPSGAIAAYYLAKAGLKVAVFEAKTFPREKACGGGLQARVSRNLPFDISPVLRGTLRGLSLSFGLRSPFTRKSADPLVYSVLRSEFDEYLLTRAAAAGALVKQGCRIRSVEIGPEQNPVVHTSDGAYTARFVIGADGANSIVGRGLNDRDKFFWQAAVYCEIPEDHLLEGASEDSCMRVDWGSLPSGYAWSFPKHGSVNVGAGGPVQFAKLFKPYVARFVASINLVKPASLPHLKFLGHHLPTLTSKTRVSGDRVLLVGDAAGLVEPFTGEGISFACQSARIAADCLLEAFSNARQAVNDYHARIMDEISPELIWARKILSLTVAFPGLFERVFTCSDAVWQTFCRVLSGDATFHRLKKEMLGPFELAWKLIDVIVQRREKRHMAAQSFQLNLT